MTTSADGAAGRRLQMSARQRYGNCKKVVPARVPASAMPKGAVSSASPNTESFSFSFCFRALPLVVPPPPPPRDGDGRPPKAVAEVLGREPLSVPIIPTPPRLGDRELLVPRPRGEAPVLVEGWRW